MHKKYYQLYKFIIGVFLVGTMMILVSAYMSNQNILALEFFSDLGKVNENNGGYVLPQAFFNFALIFIGAGLIIMNVILLNGGFSGNLNENLRLSFISGIIVGISIVFLGAFDAGMFLGMHTLAGIMFGIGTIAQMLFWLYGVKYKNSPFRQDESLIVIMISLWILAGLARAVPFEEPWFSIFYRSSILVYFIYAIFLPIRLILD